MLKEPIYGEKTVNEYSMYLRSRQLNLDPGFQRHSVWTLVDRRRLIESVLDGCPLPSIFLYRREQRGRTVYDVIDGKQRLETLFMFRGEGRFARQAFEIRRNVDGKVVSMGWRELRRHDPDARSRLDNFKLQTVEITGDLSEIIEVFVRINSTGKRLTSGERRHARYFRSPFLKAAETLVGQYRTYLRTTRILSRQQLERMKGAELFAELLMSIHHGGPINKKLALDRALGNEAVNGNTLNRLIREFRQTMGRVKRMFPDLVKVRLRNSAEFYSLFLLVWEMERDRLVLTDRKRNLEAFELLKSLSNGVDRLRIDMRSARTVRAHPVFGPYQLTIQGDTDSSANRERRRALLKGLLWTVFERKDDRRSFTPEQRRVLWNGIEQPKCARCRKPLQWGDLTLDHVKAWTLGGRTDLRNAALMHRRCNSAKGARAG